MIVTKLIVSTESRERVSQARLARILGVHRSTICRDLASWKRLLLEVMDRSQKLVVEKQTKID